MKKLLMVILAIVMVFSLAACGGGGQGSGQIDYANMTEEDLIKEFIQDESNVTVEEFVNLISTYSYVTITEELVLEENVTDKAINKLKNDGATLPEPEEYVDTLLASESPQVRGYGFYSMTSLLGTSDKHIAAAKELLKTEEDPYVIKCALAALQNEGGKDAEIGQFLLNSAKHENAAVRQQAAASIASSDNKTLDGAIDAEIELMHDSDNSVRERAYEYASQLGDERVIEPISEMLNNEADIELHDNGIKGLLKLWYDYPFHENTSEAAYRATMDYLKIQSENEDIPVYTAVTYLTSVNEDSYDEWKQKATYFNTDELYEIMVGLIKNENLNWMTRCYACRPVAVHCTKEQYQELGKIVNSLTDDDADFIKDEYENYGSDL